MSLLEEFILRFVLMALAFSGSIVSVFIARHQFQLADLSDPSSVMFAAHILIGAVFALICAWLASKAATLATAERRTSKQVLKLIEEIRVNGPQ